MDSIESMITDDNGESTTSFLSPIIVPKEHKLKVESEIELDHSDFLLIDHVKIFPSKMQFINAFEGKRFERNIEILNCGSKSAFIRIEPFSNSTFQIKCFPLGIRICPGMKIVRKLTYTYQQHNTLYLYTLPIIVNDQNVAFKITILPSVAKISIDTTLLDFGLMDVGHNITRRSFKIRNSGSKPARFSIDLGSTEFQMAVDPIKGIIQPYSENVVHVEIGSIDECVIQADIFVKYSGERFKISLTGTVIVGRLEVVNQPSCFAFTMVEFPRTYYGAKTTRRLVVRNNSAARTVFCAVYCDGENEGKPFIHDIEFSITPLDGRFEPREARIFTIDYKPVFKLGDETYHFTTLVVKKLNYCKDMNVSDYPSGLYNTLHKIKTLDEYRRRYSINLSKSSSYPSSSLDENKSSSGPEFSCNEYNQDLLSEHSLVELESVIKLCLHGEPENVNVSCVPDTLILKNMKLNQSIDRIVNLKNNSIYLPIKFVYEKVPFIEVHPKSVTLRPLAAIDIKIVLTCFNIGRVNTRICWSLYDQHSSNGGDNEDDGIETKLGKIVVQVTMEAKVVTTTPNYSINPGITPKYIRESGQYLDNVKYNTKGKIPKLIMDPIKRKERKDDRAVIAFPNDRPKTLRVIWNNNNQNVETIYAKLPRVIASTDDFYTKKDGQCLRDVYNKYLQQNRLDQLRTLQKNALPEYELTKLKQFLIFRYFAEGNDASGAHRTRGGILDGFIPLTPIQLNNIKVVPMHVTVGMMAAYSRISNSFEIINNNDVYIRIYIVPEKHRFTFPDGEGTHIHPHSTKTINFIYFSEFEGFHNIVIRIIVNEMHIFEITMMAHVVARKLYVSPHHIVFGPNDPPYKFINFYNPLNVNIDYKWEQNESNFVIEPFIGKIPPHKEMACMITYNPLQNKCNDVELRYSIDAHIKNRLSVRVETAVINTVLCDDHLNFGCVGCNLQQFRHALLWNKGNYSVELSIGTLKPMMGLEIYPQEAVILPGSCQLITVQLQSVECITFHHTVPIMINGKPTHNLQVHGQVLFPNIKFSPNPIRLKKIPVTSFEKCTLTLTNKTKAPTHLSFNFKNLMNYPFSDTKDGERFEQAEFTLEPSESKQLFLQMDPTNVTSMWYLIPFVINYILGPPMAHMSHPTKTRTYITDTVHVLPDTFPILKIFSTVLESDFTFSKASFRFVFYPFNEDKSICSESTVFTNISAKILEFCIRLDDIAPPFEIEFETGKPVTPHPFSITMELEPGESTAFCIKYRPTKNSCLSHFCALPFYVRDDYINDKHNYLELKGTFVLPEILAPKFIYLEFLPLKFRFSKTIRVLTNDHKNNCEIFAKSPNPNLQAIIKHIRRDLLHKSAEMDVTIVYTSQHVEAFQTAIHIHCDCGGAADILCYGVAENSIFTTFRVVKNVEERINFQQSFSKISIDRSELLSHILADDQISFPYFPEESDVDFKFLTDTLAVLETWLFCQGFCGRYRYSIPESFARIIPIPTKKQTNDLKATNSVDCTYVVPYVELLKLIASNQIADQFNWRIQVTSKCNDRSYQLYWLYTNILNFLKNLNAYFPHVEPELLMSYDDYKIYMTNIKVDCKKLSVTPKYHSYYNFILLSKQAWMDVILQTLKVFIFGRIKIPTDPRVLLPPNSYETDSLEEDEVAQQKSSSMDVTLTPKLSASERSVEFHKFMDDNSDNKTLHHIYSNSEYFLLNWVSYCFCKSIGTICKHSRKLVNIKEMFVNDFDSCFADSLLIVATIVTYCPYLKKYFNNLYWVPSVSDHLHHNAVKVVQALAAINCSFELRPCNIYNPINVQMALFVAYLYEFLPSLYPHTTINVGAKLSKTSSVKITIHNDSDFDICYNVSCQNDHKCFNATRSTLTIKPRSKEALKIKYTARYIRKVKAILILCGETLGKRCAKSIVYTLIGEPDVSYICESYKFCTRLYSTKDHEMIINAPYKVSACYDMFFCLEPPTSYDTLQIEDYNDIIKYRFPCCFNYYTSQILFNEQGETTIHITGVAMSLRSRKVWIFLRNAQQGDFLIYVEMVTVLTKQVEILKVCIPKDLYNKRCVCQEKGKTFCKKFVHVNVPKTNLTMLEAFTKCFVSVKGEEEKFWTAYLKKISAIRHMKKVLHETSNKDMQLYLDILIMDKTYNIKIVPGRSDVICPPSIDITNLETDYTKEKYAPLTIHVGNIPLSSLVIELWNATHKELRRYKIMFDNVTKC